MDKIRVLVVDDHPLMLIGISAMLQGVPDIEVVGTASDGASAFEMAVALKPDVILSDVVMPGVDGVELASRIRAELPDIALLMLSSDSSPATMEKLLRIGIDGFLPKTSDNSSYINADSPHILNH